MTTVYYHFPGDLIRAAILQTGREFLASEPRPREVVLHVEGEVKFRHDLGDELICDACNADIPLDAQTALTGNRLYCPPCIAKWITPYVVAS